MKRSNVNCTRGGVENLDVEVNSNSSFPSLILSHLVFKHMGSMMRLVVVFNSTQKFSSSLGKRERGLTPNPSIEMEPVGMI